MNTIATFRKCTLSNEELLKAVDTLTDKMYTTREIPSRCIPARPNEDYDLLVGELILRFKEAICDPAMVIKLHEWEIIEDAYIEDTSYGDRPLDGRFSKVLVLKTEAEK